MPTKYQIVAGLVGGVVTYRLVTLPLRRKYVHLARVLIQVGRERDALEKQMQYLVHLCNENGVTLDEFDLIVLTGIEES
jgi:hypothetical protein